MIYNDGGKSSTGRKGTSGDCGVRAMAIALGLDYDCCYKVLAQANKNAGNKKSARNGLQKSIYDKVLKEHGWVWKSAPKFNGRKAYFSDMPKDKTVIARMAKHFVAVIDQEIYDIWDSSHKMVYGYWEEAA